jgi:hypothetical protein
MCLVLSGTLLGASKGQKHTQAPIADMYIHESI